VMLVGVRVQVKPVAGEIEDVRETVPAKLFTGATVIAEAPATPALIVMLLGAAATLKSSTLNVNVAEWDSVPLVPVTVTV
jgi:hypothetical protein